MDRTKNGARTLRVCFLFSAQRHQLLHGISTAAALARRPGFRVTVMSASSEHIAYARLLAARLGGSQLHFDMISNPVLEAGRRFTGRSVPPKLLTLAALAPTLRGYDAVALPERTSIILKIMGVWRPSFVHLDHGAGDRAVGFDRRIRRFDMVLMAGEKHRQRLAREGLIREGSFAIVGYPKFEAADAARDATWTPFPGDCRPVVLYNPHFCNLSSWERLGADVLAAFADQDRYNLVLAPHVRLLDGEAAQARWAATLAPYRDHPRIRIDAGSDRCVDMTYTTLADVYLGDVSSQVYEFLRNPRPCLFLDAHGIVWEKDENYAHWRFGPVSRELRGLVDQVDAARASHGEFRRAQEQGFAETFASSDVPPSERAATAVADYLADRRQRPAARRPARS